MARLKIGFIPIEGGHYLQGIAGRGDAAPEELGFDFRVDGRSTHAVTNHYLAVAADRPRRLRHPHDDDDARHRHHRCRVSTIRCASPRMWAMLDVHVRTGGVVLGIRDRLQARRVSRCTGWTSRKRGARRFSRSSWRSWKGLWNAGDDQLQGQVLQPSREGSSRSPSRSRTRRSGIGGWGDITLPVAPRDARPTTGIPGPTADLKRLLAGKKQFLANRAGRRQDGRRSRSGPLYTARRHHHRGERHEGPREPRRAAHHDQLPGKEYGRAAGSIRSSTRASRPTSTS